jgi:homoserine dehydrogenase
MSERPLRVALLGCGVVGSEVARLMTTTGRRPGRPHRVQVELSGIAVRRPARVRNLPVDPALFTTDAAELAARPDNDVVIEVIGGIEPARSLILSAWRTARAW